MEKVLCKSLICLITLILLLNIFTAISYADNFDMKYYEKNGASTTIKEPFEKGIGAVLSVVRIVGTAISFIMIMVVAIKYMSAAPGDRADIKKSSIQFVVGALILFGSTNLLQILEQAIEKVL